MLTLFRGLGTWHCLFQQWLVNSLFVFFFVLSFFIFCFFLVQHEQSEQKRGKWDLNERWGAKQLTQTFHSWLASFSKTGKNSFLVLQLPISLCNFNLCLMNPSLASGSITEVAASVITQIPCSTACVWHGILGSEKGIWMNPLISSSEKAWKTLFLINQIRVACCTHVDLAEWVGFDPKPSRGIELNDCEEKPFQCF